jgi:hypothetical protein
MVERVSEIADEDKFHAKLLEIDVAAARAVRSGRCSRAGCGGRLDVANYPRKVRGVGEGAAVAGRYDSRLSLCCSVRGCRRRATPPSVRFLGRFVYAMRVMVAWAALCGAASRAAPATSSSAPSRQTTRRWQGYWGRVRQDARVTLLVAALVVSAGAVAPNVVVALMRSAHGTEAERAVTTHRLLAPLTTATIAPERARLAMVG